MELGLKMPYVQGRGGGRTRGLPYVRGISKGVQNSTGVHCRYQYNSTMYRGTVFLAAWFSTHLHGQGTRLVCKAEHAPECGGGGQVTHWRAFHGLVEGGAVRIRQHVVNLTAVQRSDRRDG